MFQHFIKAVSLKIANRTLEKEVNMWEKLRNIIVDKLEEAGFLKRVGSDGEIKSRKEELKNAGEKEEDQRPERKVNFIFDFYFSLFNLLKWKMDEEELKNQIENYDTLSFAESARKLATAVMIFIAILNLIFVVVGWYPEDWGGKLGGHCFGVNIGSLCL